VDFETGNYAKEIVTERNGVARIWERKSYRERERVKEFGRDEPTSSRFIGLGSRCGRIGLRLRLGGRGAHDGLCGSGDRGDGAVGEAAFLHGTIDPVRRGRSGVEAALDGGVNRGGGCCVGDTGRRW
jgi:hypothetical protein